MSKLTALVKSRRFWAAAGGVAIVVLTDSCGLSDEAAQKIVMLIGAWILGDSLSKTA